MTQEYYDDENEAWKDEDQDIDPGEQPNSVDCEIVRGKVFLIAEVRRPTRFFRCIFYGPVVCHAPADFPYCVFLHLHPPNVFTLAAPGCLN